MNTVYRWNINPFQDLLLRTLMFDVDISDKKLKREINESLCFILENILYNEEDIIYLDFNITNKNGHYKITGKNILTALWFSGIFPQDCESVLNNNNIIIGDKKYMFNQKTKNLTIEIIKN